MKKTDLMQMLSAIIAEVEASAEEGKKVATNVYKEVTEEVKSKAEELKPKGVEIKAKAKDSLDTFMEMLQNLQDRQSDSSSDGCTCGASMCHHPEETSHKSIDEVKWKHDAESISDCIDGVDGIDVSACTKHAKYIISSTIAGRAITDVPVLTAQIALLVAAENKNLLGVLFADASEDTTLECITTTSEVAEILYDTFSPLTIAKLFIIDTIK